MKLTKQLQIGVKYNEHSGTSFCTRTFPLAYCRPYSGGTTQTDKKATKSITDWVWNAKYRYNVEMPKNYEPEILNNDPISGFKIDCAVSRYSTSNKYFTIFDPRGFSLQIDTYNLEEIIRENVISCGTIQGDFMWAMHGGAHLLKAGGQKYNAMFAKKKKLESRTKITPKNIEVGKVYGTKNEVAIMYLGKGVIEGHMTSYERTSTRLLRDRKEIHHPCKSENYHIWVERVYKNSGGNSVYLKALKSLSSVYEYNDTHDFDSIEYDKIKSDLLTMTNCRMQTPQPWKADGAYYGNVTKVTLE
jgi:hypothetical protein